MGIVGRMVALEELGMGILGVGILEELAIAWPSAAPPSYTTKSYLAISRISSRKEGK